MPPNTHAATSDHQPSAHAERRTGSSSTRQRAFSLLLGGRRAGCCASPEPLLLRHANHTGRPAHAARAAGARRPCGGLVPASGLGTHANPTQSYLASAVTTALALLQVPAALLGAEVVEAQALLRGCCHDHKPGEGLDAAAAHRGRRQGGAPKEAATRGHLHEAMGRSPIEGAASPQRRGAGPRMAATRTHTCILAKEPLSTKRLGRRPQGCVAGRRLQGWCRTR